MNTEAEREIRNAETRSPGLERRVIQKKRLWIRNWILREKGRKPG